MSSNGTKHSLKLNHGFKEYLDQRKDMPPTDMPKDVANDLLRHTTCVTEDVINVPPSHTTDVAGDVVNEPQYHTGSALDATGDVVNDQPSCTVIPGNLWIIIGKRELAQLRKDAAVGREIRN